jgi:hypothetical protein
LAYLDEDELSGEVTVNKELMEDPKVVFFVVVLVIAPCREITPRGCVS